MATTTLGLTQFTGTDTMNPLTQYNADMVKIDDSAKTSKAIGSDYIYSYTTPPSYSGGTITFYSGTKYACADGRDANGDIKQTIITLSTNKTIAFSGTDDYNVYIDNGQILSSVLTRRVGIVDFVSNLPTTVGTTAPYVYYVINEHRYYYTSGSTTASWVTKIYCKVASVRVISSAITYFKPNLQLNLAQKIGKDKLLTTMYDVMANTDKEFVPSAVAVKELLATLGVDYIVEKGSNANGNYEKWNSGKLVMWWSLGVTNLAITNASGAIFNAPYLQNFPIASLTIANVTVNTANNQAVWVEVSAGAALLTNFGMYFYRPISGTVSIPFNYQAIGTWK